ncbi:cleavage stimulating factor 64-like isoform X1 [Musa acuminata AAA Group]|uniref:cleavage stimulating factor 64-like isoform X1 n=1 Tax=Musa acuminata AAA Group TaxID=214697 RepID=UPI0031D1AB74
MAASSGSQHRCVFVGNIPYDATEDQLKQLCEEVGPVVSFRLVYDRETGKPKGYGFCEYKDEETALSARRNLQGYEINGRQLRVDFAENDKNSDRNREQGHGGPGLAPSADVQKQFSGAPVLGDSTLHQPVGLPLAATAASVMAGALGGAQISNAQSVLPGQSGTGTDPLTHYLSRISRHQLHEILSEMKALATQNKALARQLMQASPQLAKALFQVQIMVGMAAQPVMQIANTDQSSISNPQNSSNVGLTSSQTLGGKFPRPPESHIAVTSQSLGILHQTTLPLQQVLVQPQYQLPLPPQGQVSQGTLAEKSGVATIPSRWPQSIGGVPYQPSLLSTSKGLISESEPPLPQQPLSTAIASLAHHPQLSLPNTALQQSILPHSLTSQTGSSNDPLLSAGLETLPKRVSTSSAIEDLTWHSRFRTQNLGVGLADQTRLTGNVLEPSNYHSKLQRLEDGSGVTQIVNGNSGINNSSLQALGTGIVAGSQMVVGDAVQHSKKQMPQLSPEVESALLQQVLSLTPEQLSSLPQEQQQQVLRLQQMLSAGKIV